MKKLYILTYWQHYRGSNDNPDQIRPAEVFASKAEVEAAGKEFGRKVQYVDSRPYRAYQRQIEEYMAQWKRDNPEINPGRAPVAPRRQDFAYLDDVAWAAVQEQFVAATEQHRELKRQANLQAEEWTRRYDEALNAYIVGNPPAVVLTPWDLENLNGDCYWDVTEIELTDERAAELSAALAA